MKLELRSPATALGTLVQTELDDNYNDHIVVIFSVNRIDVPGKASKIVVVAIDRNDHADECKAHSKAGAMSELTPGSADK
jgi:hypothetical protein